MNQEDEPVSAIPVYYSNSLYPNVHLHQFPLLTRPLQVPPTALASGKRITARVKPSVRRLEIHVPVDTRPRVWNPDKAKILGAARVQDDREKSQEVKKGIKDHEEPRLSEIRLRSEEIPQRACYMLGLIRHGNLHLHHIEQINQFRPALDYLDLLSRKNKRSRGNGSDYDSDDGPPPDPDEPAPLTKKEKAVGGDVKEVQVTTRKADEKAGRGGSGTLSATRREMLHILRNEEDEKWKDLQYSEANSAGSIELTERIFAGTDNTLECTSKLAMYLKDIEAL